MGIWSHAASMLKQAVLAVLLMFMISGYSVRSAAPSSLQELAGFEYLDLISAGGNPDHPLPMVVALHYLSGGPHTSMEDYAELNIPVRFILLAGPFRYKDGYAWFPGGEAFYDRDLDQQSEAIMLTAEKLADFLAAISSRFPTVGQPVVTGYSQGGDLVFALALNHPGKISAALPMGGRLLRGFRNNMEEAQEYPHITIFHGEQDPIVPLSEAKNAFRFLTSVGINVELLTYPDTAHDYPEKMKVDYQTTVKSEIVNLLDN